MTDAPRSVVVTHVYSKDNKGDAALLSVLLQDLRQLAPDAGVVVQTLEAAPDGDDFEGVPVTRSLMSMARRARGGRVGKLAYSLGMVSYTLLTATARRVGIGLPMPPRWRGPMSQLQHADLVVPVGGGYLRGRQNLTSLAELVLLLHPLVLAKVFRKPVILYAQSIGPFYGPVQPWLAARVLARMDLIIAREDVTVDLLACLGVAANVVRGVDSGFAFAPPPGPDIRASLGLPAGVRVVGVTVRQWLNAAGQARYEQAIADLADTIILRWGYRVLFIPQVTSPENGDDDRVAADRVLSRMTQPAGAQALRARFSHQEIKSVYAGLDYVVGTRFHSVIFALTSFVPAIAIEYEHKTRGMMRDLGLANWVVGIEHVEGPALVDMFARLVDARRDYQDHLRARVPDYAAGAKRLPELARGVYAARNGAAITHSGR